jgi:hypothetical protein
MMISLYRRIKFNGRAPYRIPGSSRRCGGHCIGVLEVVSAMFVETPERPRGARACRTIMPRDITRYLLDPITLVAGRGCPHGDYD